MCHSVTAWTQLPSRHFGALVARTQCRAEVIFEQICQDLDQLVQVFLQGGIVRRKLSFDLHWGRVVKPNLRHRQKVAVAVLPTEGENPGRAYYRNG